MSKLAALAVLLLFPSFVSAGTATVTWLDATIAYDPSVWRVHGSGETGGLLFTCIAADCPGSPLVVASARRLTADDTADTIGQRPWPRGYDAAPVTVPDTPLGFSVVSAWSGCRARDAPILQARAQGNGILWRLHTGVGVGSGCNFGPELPLARLIELLQGIKPSGPRGPAPAP